MDKILLLLANCKCGVHIQVNAHRDYYETAKQHLKNAEMGEEGSLNIPPDVRKIMEATNTVVSVVFCPDTPIGSYRIYHHDLPTAIDLALSCLPLCKRCSGTGREYISGTAAASGREYVCSVCKGTARVPSLPSNAKVCGPAQVSPTAQKPSVAGSVSTDLLGHSRFYGHCRDCRHLNTCNMSPLPEGGCVNWEKPC